MIQKMKKLTFLVTSKEYETFLEKLRELGLYMSRNGKVRKLMLICKRSCKSVQSIKPY